MNTKNNINIPLNLINRQEADSIISCQQKIWDIDTIRKEINKYKNNLRYEVKELFSDEIVALATDYRTNFDNSISAQEQILTCLLRAKVLTEKN